MKKSKKNRAASAAVGHLPLSRMSKGKAPVLFSRAARVLVLKTERRKLFRLPIADERNQEKAHYAASADAKNANFLLSFFPSMFIVTINDYDGHKEESGFLASCAYCKGGNFTGSAIGLVP